MFFLVNYRRINNAALSHDENGNLNHWLGVQETTMFLLYPAMDHRGAGAYPT